MLAIASPYTRYTDLVGGPNQGGYVYFGVANDNPRTAEIAVFWDAAGTQPASQPLRTQNGYIMRAGTPANVFCATDYSTEVTDAEGRRVYYAPSAAEFNGLISLQGPDGALDVGYTANGLGAVTQTVKHKLDNFRGPKDFGATGIQADDATVPGQQAIDAALDDDQPGNSDFFPDGTYSTTGWNVDLTSETTSGAGRFSAFGVGNSSCILMKASPNQNIFNITGAAGQSFGSDIRHLRFQVSPQGDNVNSYVLDTGLTSTMLDFQIQGTYTNGMARGFGGQFVSGIFSGNTFDFMTDYGIHGKSKEFRKIEIVSNHIYKVAQRGVYIQGDTDSSGNPTDIADRDNGRGAGHMTISCNGFDRLFSNTQVCQHIYADQIDNTVISSNWFNGKTPDSTDYPLDIIRIVGGRNVVIGMSTAWLYGRGLYLQDCDNVTVIGLQIAGGNQAGSTSAGAVTMVNCSNSAVLGLQLKDAAGTGMVMTDCTDCYVQGRITDSQFSGFVMNGACSRIRAQVEVVDANKADSGTAAQTYGIDIGGTSSGIYLDGSRSYVTNAAAGQKVNLHIGTSTSSVFMNGGVLTLVRTGGVAVQDTGAIASIRGVRGWTTKNAKATNSVSVVNPATSATFAHGMDVTPTAAQVRLTPTNATAAATPYFVSVSGANVTVTASPSSGTATWGWSIDAENS